MVPFNPMKPTDRFYNVDDVVKHMFRQDDEKV